jgi:hypothetical protein
MERVKKENERETERMLLVMAKTRSKHFLRIVYHGAVTTSGQLTS